jgi:hypothetical protein
MVVFSAFLSFFTFIGIISHPVEATFVMGAGYNYYQLKNQTTKPLSTKPHEQTSSIAEEVKDVKLPEVAENVSYQATKAGTVVLSYNLDSKIDQACKDQEKEVTKSGWKTHPMMLLPIEANGTWYKTYQKGSWVLSLVCAEDPVNKPKTLVTLGGMDNSLSSQNLQELLNRPEPKIFMIDDIAIPADAKDIFQDPGWTGYKTDLTIDEVCADQAKKIEEAGWKTHIYEGGSKNPIKIGTRWNQVFEKDDAILTLNCQNDSTKKAKTSVSMNTTEKALAFPENVKVQ